MAPRGKLYGMIAIVALVVVGIGVIAFGYLSDYISDKNLPGSTAISVDDSKYSVSDYTERSRMFSEQFGSTAASSVISSVSADIIDEVILLDSSAELGVEATDDEIKAEIAELLGITADDPNFDARYQEELAAIELTEEEYRDMARANVLQDKVNDKFEADLPATVDSVHYRQIQVADQAAADDIVAQLAAGGDFAALAAEQSVDTTTKDTGGDKGWVPRGILAAAQEDLLFSLDPAQVTIYPSGAAFFVYELIERDEAHELEEEDKPTLASTEYNELDHREARCRRHRQRYGSSERRWRQDTLRHRQRWAHPQLTRPWATVASASSSLASAP